MSVITNFLRVYWTIALLRGTGLVVLYFIIRQDDEFSCWEINSGENNERIISTGWAQRSDRALFHIYMYTTKKSNSFGHNFSIIHEHKSYAKQNEVIYWVQCKREQKIKNCVWLCYFSLKTVAECKAWDQLFPLKYK